MSKRGGSKVLVRNWLRRSLAFVAAVTALSSAPGISFAQGSPFGPPRPMPTAREQQPRDFTGYWVSLVTEDWRFRMMVAPPGDVESVPLNPKGMEVAKAWNPDVAKTKPDEFCKAFGAAGVMRLPGRLHITWQDDQTLKVETDAGTQTRLFHFGEAPRTSVQPSWQGYSTASWDETGPRLQPFEHIDPALLPKEGYIKVVTNNLRPGYLRTNGVPYGADTRLVEYFDGFSEPNAEYLVVTTVVTDPEHLREPFVTSSHFKKLPDAAGWDPTPCRANEPR